MKIPNRALKSMWVDNKIYSWIVDQKGLDFVLHKWVEFNADMLCNVIIYYTLNSWFDEVARSKKFMVAKWLNKKEAESLAYNYQF